MTAPRLGGFAAVGLAVAAIVGFHTDAWSRPPTVAVVFFAFFALVYVAVLSLAARGRTFRSLPVATGRVVAVVPAYNEDPGRLHTCIQSLLSGTIVPDAIHVVDDGSADPAPPFHHPRVTWRRQPNLGKRRAQVTGLRGEETADFVLTVDSDSIVDKHALEQALRAMSDERIQAVTATCLVENRTTNLLTRVTDVEVVTGNFVMRRARSVMGIVAPTSGPFALYRAPIFFDNIADYVTSGTYGDDRRLTHYALMRGQVVACDQAIVRMHMPDTVRGMFQQRTRWFQGYFRYLTWELRNLKGFALFMRSWNLLVIVAFPVIVVYAFVVIPLAHGIFFWEVLVYWLALLYAQTIHYLAGRPQMSLPGRFVAWVALTPLVVLTQFLIVRPAMYYSITRLRSLAWVTREAPG